VSVPGISPEWPAARMARLRELHAAGLSYAAIGRALGSTASAVIGKAHRLGLAGRQSPIIRDADDPRRRPAPAIVPRAGKVTLPPLASLR
jgi:GcrA cell cycle regulator